MSSKNTIKAGSVAVFHTNADNGCIVCGKSGDLPYEVQLFNGRYVNVNDWGFWVDNQREIGVYYVCYPCSLKFGDNVLIEC